MRKMVELNQNRNPDRDQDQDQYPDRIPKDLSPILLPKLTVVVVLYDYAQGGGTIKRGLWRRWRAAHGETVGIT